MQDLRLALRLLQRQPLTSALAVVALALGIGLTTLMFSILNGAVLRGLPFEASDRLYHAAPFDTAASDDLDTSHWEFAAWRERQRSFDDLAGFYVATANVVGPDGTPERYRAAWITPNTFGLLRARPAQGRDFDPAAGVPGAEPVALISDRLWHDRFGGRPDALGQVLRVNGRSVTVIGVMPPRFAFPTTQDLWLPLTLTPARELRDTAQRLEVIGRLRDGVSPGEAQAELATIERALLADDPTTQAAMSVEVKTYVEEFIGTSTVQLLTTMLAAVTLVLVIACVNVTNLVLARAVEQARDVAVRTALGASRGRVMRQTLTEVGLLTAAGALGGVGLAWTGITIFNRGITDTNPPFWLDIRVDATVLLFVAGLAVSAALVAGLVPAWRSSRQDVAPLLHDDSRGNTGLRIGRVSRGLVAAEMALSFALLVVSGLMIQSVRNVTGFDPGFATRDVLAARVSLPAAEYSSPEAERRFADDLQARLARLPGVTAAALATGVPPNLPEDAVAIDGRTYAHEREYPRAQVTAVSPGFFDVLRVRPRVGRLLGASDTADGLPVAVVSETFARTHYPQGALGRRVQVDVGEAGVWRTIVGVVQDMREVDLGPSELAGVYVPLAQAPSRFAVLLLHVQGDPLGTAPGVRRAVADLDRNLPIYDVRTLQQHIDANTWGWRVFGTLFSIFGLAALVLATVGLYGVMAFAVSKRTAEIGVRLALGAEPRDVIRLVLTEGAWQVGTGVAVGLGLAVLLARAMQLFFFDVGAGDPATYLAVAVVLLSTGLLAAFVPARRASRVDPGVALRSA